MRLLKEPISLACRVCHSSPETIGHILSSCEPLKWTLYKQRHDRILYQLVLSLCWRLSITLPEGLKWGTAGWVGVAVVVSSEAKLDIDLNIPTDSNSPSGNQIL